MTILQTLVQYIRTASSKNHIHSSGIPRIVAYLLGENIQENELSDQNLYNIYNGQSLSSDTIFSLITSTNWSIKRLKQSTNHNIDEELLQKNVTSLTSHHNLLNQELSLMIKDLVFLHFFDTCNPNILFPMYTEKLCDKYIRWEDKEKELLQLLQENNILFLTGNPGSGKKQLIKSILKNYCNTTYPDILFLDSKGISIREQIDDINFINCIKYNLNTIISYLKQKPTTSVLVIDMPTITKEDFLFIQKNLLTINMRIIITTRNTNIPKEFKSLNIDNRPSKNLTKIFYSINHNTTFTNDEFEQLYEFINHNPYITRLIAQTLLHSPNLKDKFLDKDKWIWHEKNLPKIHASCYADTKSGLQILKLMGFLLNRYEYKTLNNSFSQLSIWAKHPLEEQLLKKYFSSDIIEDAISYGILQYYNEDNTKLIMPSIIADTIWNQYPISYQDYYDKITLFLNSIRIGQIHTMPYTDLYPIILNMIFRFQFQVMYMKSRITTEKKEDFKKWNILLLDLTQQFIKLGNQKAAQKILPYLFYYNQKNRLLILL